MNAEQMIKLGRPYDTLPQLQIKGHYDQTIQDFRFARFYIGLNCIFQEMTKPSGLISIPIPFMRQDKAFIRYKAIKPSNSTVGGIVSKRLDLAISKLEFEVKRQDAKKNKEIQILMCEHDLYFLKQIRGY